MSQKAWSIRLLIVGANREVSMPKGLHIMEPVMINPVVILFMFS
jgi:hypothetical protein